MNGEIGMLEAVGALVTAFTISYSVLWVLDKWSKK